VFSAVAKAKEHFGRIDVLVSNAGYGHFGAVETFSESELRQQMEVNFFGSINAIQAVLPIMREQNAGHIFQLSSIGGVLSFPLSGVYHASKWALEGLCDTLAQEVAEFNIKITLIEPGPFATNFKAAAKHTQKSIPVYENVIKRFADISTNAVYEDPKNVAMAALKAVDLSNPPLRILVGTGLIEAVKANYASRLETWAKWPK
jgi:NAD(P)-dependent dehydrogenase (short-subunit alcohol dehydrogenase family)